MCAGRHDAGLAASELALAVEDAALAIGDPSIPCGVASWHMVLSSCVPSFAPNLQASKKYCGVRGACWVGSGFRGLGC